MPGEREGAFLQKRLSPFRPLPSFPKLSGTKEHRGFPKKKGAP